MVLFVIKNIDFLLKAMKSGTAPRTKILQISIFPPLPEIKHVGSTAGLLARFVTMMESV